MKPWNDMKHRVDMHSVWVRVNDPTQRRFRIGRRHGFKGRFIKVSFVTYEYDYAIDNFLEQFKPWKGEQDG